MIANRKGIFKILVKWLNQYQASKCVNQPVMADAVNVSLKTYSRWVNSDYVRIGLDKQYRIARLTDNLKEFEKLLEVKVRNKEIYEDRLIANGYSRYESNKPISMAEYLYQKCICDENSNKLYYITFSFFQYKAKNYESWDATIQFVMDNATVNLEFIFDDESTIQFVEETCEKFYRTFKCVPISERD